MVPMRRTSCWKFVGDRCRLLCRAPNEPHLLERFARVTKNGFIASEEDVDLEDIEDLLIWLKLVAVYDEVKILFQEDWDDGWTGVFISSDGVCKTYCAVMIRRRTTSICRVTCADVLYRERRGEVASCRRRPGPTIGTISLLITSCKPAGLSKPLLFYGGHGSRSTSAYSSPISSPHSRQDIQGAWGAERVSGLAFNPGQPVPSSSSPAAPPAWNSDEHYDWSAYTPPHPPASPRTLRLWCPPLPASSPPSAEPLVSDAISASSPPCIAPGDIDLDVLPCNRRSSACSQKLRSRSLNPPKQGAKVNAAGTIICMCGQTEHGPCFIPSASLVLPNTAHVSSLANKLPRMLDEGACAVIQGKGRPSAFRRSRPCGATGGADCEDIKSGLHGGLPGEKNRTGMSAAPSSMMAGPAAQMRETVGDVGEL
ncbi:hypothetical protein DFH09DRAFT_1110668 [Mycena vulgaris]|nr:hypothetical protein DFH09DRAFT_1110668 [Mycena vulgaris]